MRYGRAAGNDGSYRRKVDLVANQRVHGSKVAMQAAESLRLTSNPLDDFEPALVRVASPECGKAVGRPG